MEKIAITTGDPNGIGAEITIKALRTLDLPSDKFVLISNTDVLKANGGEDICEKYEIIEIPYSVEDIKYGKVTKEAGEFSFRTLEQVCRMKPRAIVTAPVSKFALYLAGHVYSGQTEVLQKYLAHDGQSAEMLFVAGSFKVLLLTRHCALKDVILTKELIVDKVQNLANTFKTHFGVENPKFALCGFNPHAGEDGIMGREEINIMAPAVQILRARGIDITEPLPSDTLFTGAAKAYYENKKGMYDCYIANYHDQGLIPIKTVAGDKTVNMTIGLDIVRTSPGHGTAFDIAGRNIARPDGMIEAIKAVL
jgi:4-hydroxythreonine-4-phosphate dehydrogenase